MRASWFRFVGWFFLAFLGISILFFGTVFWLSGPSAGVASWWPQDPIARKVAVTWLAKLAALYVFLMVLAFAATGWLVARKTFAPIVSLNDQLHAIEPHNLQVQVQIQTDDRELRELQEHINGLLSRISLSFHQLQGHSAQVAHELRAPLTIIRLKIEEAADKIEPALAEEIQTELLRLTMHVEQALLIARAEQGHLRPNPVRFNLAELLEDIVQDFRLLARDQGRQIEVAAEKGIVSADPKYLKQILYSLLTNSLRHGHGAIYVELTGKDQGAVLSIRNQVKTEESDETLDLGLGRRIVAALIALQGNMRIQTERKEGWYNVTLSILEGTVPKENRRDAAVTER
jgi:signal transduction histidine kinase